MGNHKFRLSEMTPNALFNKLRHMKKNSKSKSHNTEAKEESSSSATISQHAHVRQQPGTYYLNSKPRISGKYYTSSPSNTHFPDSPRRSKRRSKRKTIYKPSPKLTYKCHDAKLSPLLVESSDYFVSSTESSPGPDILHEVLESGSESNSFVSTEKFEEISAFSSPCNCKFSSTTADIIIDMNDQSINRETGELEEVVTTSEIELPPIVTKLRNVENDQSDSSRRSFSRKKKVTSRPSFSVKIYKDEKIRTNKEHRTSPYAQKPSSNTISGIRLRANAPKISSRKLQACARKSISSCTGLKFRNKNLSGSFAVEKSSRDPQRDFRDSMMEMILEKDIKASKDLEDLLACYLELNSNEYHDLIITAFEQIWLDMADFEL